MKANILKDESSCLQASHYTGLSARVCLETWSARCLHEIEDDYDVFVAFETMNNRGKKLTNLELLKNRLT
ncbi:MAG: hypothetical protein KGZ57_11975 [Dethiobacter sp.]|nr:hypothetical protein [Dethiobacter sp.]